MRNGIGNDNSRNGPRSSRKGFFGEDAMQEEERRELDDGKGDAVGYFGGKAKLMVENGQLGEQAVIRNRSLLGKISSSPLQGLRVARILEASIRILEKYRW